MKPRTWTNFIDKVPIETDGLLPSHFYSDRLPNLTKPNTHSFWRLLRQLLSDLHALSELNAQG